MAARWHRSPRPPVGTGAAGLLSAAALLTAIACAQSSNSTARAPSTCPDQAIAYVLRVNPQITFELGGHTDSKGSAVYNKELSQRRVDNVAAHLLALGVAPRRFVAQGHGEDIPVDTNRTADGRAHNRRVELHRTDVPDCRP